jgi:1,4-alpha-glucan branching enzyme
VLSTGINDFVKKSAFNYEKGIARFFLPGHKDAANVYLSGSFNNWSTMQNPMSLTDSGWVIQIKLRPGKYHYKYIVNGRWGTDPNNAHEEKDDQRRTNSVVFCYNHTFVLNDKKESRKVIVTGNFTNWDREIFPMKKTAKGWALDIFLPEGTYTYKFIADGEWMEDKANPDNRMDANGNINSFFSIGEQFIFRLSGYPNARKVIIAGSFNGWREDELLMKKDSTGWHLPVALAPGTYEYKFIVDGKWITDPSNPALTGSGNYTNSLMSFKANHTFVLGNYPEAANVNVAGSFNGWRSDSYRMVKENGKWKLPLYLKPGKYTYKFIVDEKWILDPANELYEANEYGTNNSVLWVEQ